RRRLLRPGERAGDDLFAAPFDRTVAVVAGTAKPEARVVDVEAAVESWRRPVAWIEDQRPDEGRRSIACVAQKLGKIRHGPRQRSAKVVDAMTRGIAAGEERRVRYGRHRRLRVRAGEDG